MGYTPLLIRGTVLFFLGVFFCLVFNLLQVQRESTIFSPEVLARLFSSAWWVAPCCGIAAAVIGLLYPCLDERLGEPHTGEWSNVMRCIAVFVGINHASAKIDFENNLQFSLTLTAMSIGLWWLFDRSGSGFGLGVAIAIVATFITQLLIYHGVQRLSGGVTAVAVIFLISIDTAWNMGLYNQNIQYTKLDYLFVRSWLPCTFFSGGVTMGNIGRQLAMYDHRKVKDE